MVEQDPWLPCVSSEQRAVCHTGSEQAFSSTAQQGNLVHPILQSWQLSHRKCENLFLRDFLGTHFRSIPVAEKDRHQSTTYPVGGKGEFFHRHHLFLM